MQNQLCVSSYSLRQHLGPIRVISRGADGQKAPFIWEQPQTMSLLEFPLQVRDKLGINAVEICQFHIPERTPDYLGQLKRALDDTAIESYQRLARVAASLGLQLLIENHGGITADPAVIVAIVEAVGPDQLKTLVDIGNFEPLLSMQMAIMQGHEPPEVDATPVYGALAQIAPYAGLVHAKTHDFDAHGQPRYLDVVRALRVVRDAGYAGTISIEYEGNNGDAWENTRRTRELVEQAFG